MTKPFVRARKVPTYQVAKCTKLVGYDSLAASCNSSGDCVSAKRILSTLPHETDVTYMAVSENARAHVYTDILVRLGGSLAGWLKHSVGETDDGQSIIDAYTTKHLSGGAGAGIKLIVNGNVIYEDSVSGRDMPYAVVNSTGDTVYYALAVVDTIGEHGHRAVVEAGVVSSDGTKIETQKVELAAVASIALRATRDGVEVTAVTEEGNVRIAAENLTIQLSKD